MSCIFCKIINGKAPAYIIYKNEYVTAFLDINPMTYGHTLVVPNEHIPRLDMIKDEKISRFLMEGIIDVSHLLIKAGICESFSLLQDNGTEAEQEMEHVHFHIIPRYRGDGLDWNLKTNKELAKEKNLKKAWESITQYKYEEG
ncbi:HIT family protein [Fervidibacillus albus]|uniref:HIT domain-containing protein n=1 Tax=Fervidibacillus albus TaxID=2980026 RepID=A0A9E8LSR7_9BACI|nr:HIT domain-containing protein [Fervidibacillus albus]WAA08923.1 HIT domain-containing protein [Fervidibacillus albus]